MGDNRSLIEYYGRLDLWIKSVEAHRRVVDLFLGKLGNKLDQDAAIADDGPHEQEHNYTFGPALEADWCELELTMTQTSVDLLREATAYGVQTFGFAAYHRCPMALELLVDDLLQDSYRRDYYANTIRDYFNKARSTACVAISLAELEKRYQRREWKKLQKFDREELDALNRRGITLDSMFDEDWTGGDCQIIPGIRDTVPWLNEWLKCQG